MIIYLTNQNKKKNRQKLNFRKKRDFFFFFRPRKNSHKKFSNRNSIDSIRRGEETRKKRFPSSILCPKVMEKKAQVGQQARSLFALLEISYQRASIHPSIHRVHRILQKRGREGQVVRVILVYPAFFSSTLPYIRYFCSISYLSTPCGKAS